MDFVALIIFLALYYLRPQEWLSSFNALHPVQLLSVMALWSMIARGKIRPRDLVRTPLDWLIVAYFVWTLIAGFQFWTTLNGIEAVLLFYFVAVRSLDTIPRLKKFLGWWCAFMLIIAALALASLVGIDPLGSADLTNGVMKDRLILNLSVFNNPNTLAHSVVPAIPLVYYLVFWRRIFMKAGVILMAIPLACIFLTQSKGAYLCGFAVILTTLIFGRSRIWQILVIALAISFGYGALYALPRMNELRHSKTDPAIQGRVAAFQYGLELMQTHFFGIGLGNFESYFFHYGPLEKETVTRISPGRQIPAGPNAPAHELDAKRHKTIIENHYLKATHCAYNQNGAELGYVGLFLFVGILYCCLRTLLLVKSRDNEEERIRRALFATVIAYAISSWMVDFCYRPTFFLMVAAISAFHRHLLRKQTEEIKATEPAELPAPVKPWLRRLPPIRLPGIPLPGLSAPLPAGAVACLPAELPAAPASPVLMRPAGAGTRTLPWQKSTLEENLLKRFIWTRLGILDFAIMLFLTYVSIRIWEHMIAMM
jgi:hypothetical protein